MSLRATLWVLDEAPVTEPVEMLVLVALADEANDNGRGAWPAVKRIARRARCSERTVHRVLRRLEEQGVIRRGDQGLVLRIPVNRRPVVWDIAMPDRGDTVTPQRTSGVTRKPSWGDTRGSSGVTRVADNPKFLTQEKTLNRGSSTCTLHLLVDPCRGCAADRLVSE